MSFYRLCGNPLPVENMIMIKTAPFHAFDFGLKIDDDLSAKAQISILVAR